MCNACVHAAKLAALLTAIEADGYEVSTTSTGNIWVGDVLVMAPGDVDEPWEARPQ